MKATNSYDGGSIILDPIIGNDSPETKRFDEHDTLHKLHRYLPEQAALKDFIHQNTLQAFQGIKFYDGLRQASQILGYKVSFSIDEYRALFKKGSIREDILKSIITRHKGTEEAATWYEKAISGSFGPVPMPRIGALRSNWKRQYKLDMDSLVHPILFRILCSYLDQGISIWSFPVRDKGFLAALIEMESNSLSSFFRGKRAGKMLVSGKCTIQSLLRILIGSDESLYQQYLFDQQFAHQGWSGMVSVIEMNPQTLLDTRKISIRDLIIFELLLEIDAMDFAFGEWQPMSQHIARRPVDLFRPIPSSELSDALAIWQDAFEWTYYDGVLKAIAAGRAPERNQSEQTFQAMFCIDDREESFRRYLEQVDPRCETYATPGFFAVDCYFQPEGGKFYTKICPAPVTPKYLIKESNPNAKRDFDPHFSKHSHSFYTGWLISQTIGFWSALKLLINIFKPSLGPATTLSFNHMDKLSALTIENSDKGDVENGLQIGYTVDEMTNRVESVLTSIGLVKDFAPIVYVVGHGASSVNNPHFAAYDCGACSGRPGSVNSRAFCFMANHAEVRQRLSKRGINIPDTTQFLGGLHDTTRDEVAFFDEAALSTVNQQNHVRDFGVFEKALHLNAKERSRRFESINTSDSPSDIHEQVKLRSVSLFEPRPELNHATNALCIVGRRSLTKHIFFDRRAFYNSYDHTIDPEGNYLLSILRPAAPVCGGINLEYFFSRVDNQKLGAGTKLPHNVMGLFGVANGIDGDLRPGLPSQMIEVHDPVRLMIIIEHFPEVVLSTIKRSPETYEWFINEWVHLATVNPETLEVSVFRAGAFETYSPMAAAVNRSVDLTPMFESTDENLPVCVIQ